MPVPATIEVCEKYLFADVNEMAADGIPELIQQRLIRLRDMYNYWLQFPRKKDLEIVQELEYRYKFCQMIDETFEMARRIKDARAMGAAANYYGKYTQLDKEDILDKGYDKIIVQPFEPTDDPTVLGIKPIPNVRDRIKSKIQQYWSDDIEDVDFEEVEFNEDDIFNPKPKE